MIIFEAAYDLWLCRVVLFDLCMAISGLFVRGHRTEERERVPRGMTQPASCGSGAVIGSVWYSGDSWRS